jgi:hypothetical protein
LYFATIQFQLYWAMVSPRGGAEYYPDGMRRMAGVSGKT